MKLFLDTSVLLAAALSVSGASRRVLDRAEGEGWTLIATPYVVLECETNLRVLSHTRAFDWSRLHRKLQIAPDVLTLDRITILSPAKDRPILFSALAWCDVLLTLDRRDFQHLLGTSFYGLPILTPAEFLTKSTHFQSP